MVAKSRLELLVGAFIFIGLIILVLFVFLIRDFQIIKPGYKFDIIFGFANGVKVSAPVRLAGVDVGEVKSLKIFYDPASQRTKVRVKAWVAQESRIPLDSDVWINTLGLLGEKYIEIIPGNDYNLLVKNGDVVSGEDPVSMEEVTKEAKKIVLKFDGALNGLNDILGRISSGEGTIGKLIYDGTVYKNLEEMSDDLKRNPWKLLYKSKEKTELRR